MIWLVAGTAALVLMLLGMNAFARASVATVRWIFAFFAALGGLLVAVLLFLAGQGPRLVAGLALAGPVLWRRWQMGGGAHFNASPGQRSPPPPRSGGSGLTRDEAYDVLGLEPGASEQEILAAHRRLMRMAHPDAGGSDWLASRINQARDILLG
jgi:DnaJ homolog subfamily C member 19